MSGSTNAWGGPMLGPLELLGGAARLVSVSQRSPARIEQPAPSLPCVVPWLVRWRSFAQTLASSSPQLRLGQSPEQANRQARKAAASPAELGGMALAAPRRRRGVSRRAAPPSLSDRYLSRPTSSPAHGRLLRAPRRSFAWVWTARREEWIR
ncbi:hypothetical protein TRIUR3_15701 [Triticum urartu]|uniref:Uncharacterized protein n=1 Tax=Triticum urartu TaxID=4572 RepID=M7ZIF4_TRIUA|nr:hypothetical protein TRIUR3_15701 [Triticum urartu]